MPEIKKGRKNAVKKGRKNAEKSKKAVKVKGRAKDEVKLPAPMIDIKVKFDPDDQTFTYRDAEKVMEADNDATDCTMELSEYVRSIRPEVMEDIKPKIEPGIKQEPYDPDFDLNSEFKEANLEDVVVKEEIPDGPTTQKQPNKKLKPTECHICHKIYKDKEALRYHAYTHKEKTRKCDICGKLFGLKGTLDRHKQTHLLNRKMFPCDICQQEFFHKSHLERHQNIHNLSRDLYECEICHRKLTSKSDLRRHIQTVHEAIKQKCSFCDKEFSSKYDYIVHMRSKHFNLLRQQDKGTGDLHPIFRGIRSYECYRCKCSRSSITEYKKHMKRCLVFRPAKCELCNKRFINAQRLQGHLRSIHSICEGKLEREQKLKTAAKTFECIDCKAPFMGRTGLTKHMRLHCHKRRS